MKTMRLQPSSPELIPTSSPPGLTPAKRPNPTSDLVLASSPTDPNQPKKAKPDSIDLDCSEEHVARIFLTPEDRILPPDEFWSKRMDGFIEAMMAKVPKSCAGLKKKLPETLPEGCTWGYYVPGSGVRSYVVKMFCFYCGAAHLEEDCPNKDTQEAKPLVNFPIFRPKTK